MYCLSLIHIYSLGLDVHDPSIDNIGLLEGMVITIEPGLYIEEEGIGTVSYTHLNQFLLKNKKNMFK